MRVDAKIGLIAEGIRAYKESENKERKRTALHNTELLLKNYNKLAQHADNAVYNIKHVYGTTPVIQSDLHGYSDEDEENGIENGTLYIDAILKSKVRTTIMLMNVDVALTQLQQNAIVGGYINKADALIGVYIKGHTFENLADELKCTPLTVRRWKNDALRELSILLYGVDGLFLAG